VVVHLCQRNSLAAVVRARNFAVFACQRFGVFFSCAAHPRPRAWKAERTRNNTARAFRVMFLGVLQRDAFLA